MGVAMVLCPAFHLEVEEALLSYADRLSLMHTNRANRFPLFVSVSTWFQNYQARGR